MVDTNVIGYLFLSSEQSLLAEQALQKDSEWAAPILWRSAWQKPWEDRPHVDLLHQFTFGGAGGKYPLAAYAIGHGVNNPKSGGNGSHVAQLVADRKGAELLSYCLGDVEATAELWERWQNATGV